MHRYVLLLDVLAALIDENLAKSGKAQFLALPMSFVCFPSEEYTRSRESAIPTLVGEEPRYLQLRDLDSSAANWSA